MELTHTSEANEPPLTRSIMEYMDPELTLLKRAPRPPMEMTLRSSHKSAQPDLPGEQRTMLSSKKGRYGGSWHQRTDATLHCETIGLPPQCDVAIGLDKGIDSRRVYVETSRPNARLSRCPEAMSQRVGNPWVSVACLERHTQLM